MKTDELFQLFQNRKTPQNAKAGREFYNITESNKDGEKRAALYLYDEISWWAYNDANTFRQRLSALDADVIDLHINSPGGSVFEGVAIYNLLLAHKARVEVHIDGLAASIASVIALAGDEIHIAENAMVMIHNPSAIALGESQDLRKMADILDAIKGSILNTYESCTNLERGDLEAAMDAETWYSADEAIANGFASKKVSPMKAAARWSGEDFKNLPEQARAFGSKKQDGKPQDSKEEEEALPPTVPETVGSVDDVTAARERVANLMKKHGYAHAG